MLSEEISQAFILFRKEVDLNVISQVGNYYISPPIRIAEF